MDKKIVDKVWEKAKPVVRENPAEIRQDPYGNKIRRSSYGKDTLQGWEIDHIKPKSRGGTDAIKNLQAMQTRKNQDLGDTTKKRSRHSQK